MMRFRRQHPGIFVHLHNVTGADGLGMIRGDEVDFAVGSMLEVPEDIDYRPIWHFNPALIMSRDHPLARRREIELADISPHGLILPPRRLSTYQVVDLVFQKHGLPFRVNLEVGGWEVIKRYVAMGMGISIVTSICLTETDRKQLAVRDMSRYFPRRSYGAVLRRGGYLSPQAERLLQAYLSQRPQVSSPFVFVSYLNEGLSTTAIHKRLMRYRHQAGVDLTAHRLRHTFANDLVKANVAVTTIQKLLGHTWLETTQSYIAANDRQVQADYAAACRLLEAWQ